MDTPEKRIARAEELDAFFAPAEQMAISGKVHEMRTLLPALAADAKRGIRYEQNLCAIAKVLTTAKVPLTIETPTAKTIDRIDERVTVLVAERDAAIARADAAELDRAALVEQVAQKNRELQNLGYGLREAVIDIKRHSDDHRYVTPQSLLRELERLCTT